MKSVLISIHPKWCELIAAGKKTVEVRKTKPKLATPFKVYIYCTRQKEWFRYSSSGYASNESLWLANGKVEMCDGFKYWHDGGDYTNLNGKVIGEFVCDKTFDICIEVSDPDDLPGYPFPCTGLTDKEILQYLGNGKTGYGWHISQLKIYDDPKPLWMFMKCGAPSEKELDEELCSYCEQTEWGERRSYGTPTGPVMCEGAFCGQAYDLYLDEHFTLKRPPQSWCYVEELSDGTS